MIGCTTVYHRTNKIERDYLHSIDICIGGISVDKSLLPAITHRAIDFINQYSNMKLQIICDTLISTEDMDGNSIITNNNKYKIGYKVKIIPKNNGLFAISVKCYTTAKFTNKKEQSNYGVIMSRNRLIFLNYLATEKVMPKFINNPKEYDIIYPKGEAAIDLD